MTAIEQFNEKINAFEQQKKALIKSLKKDFKSVLKELFTTVPEIKTLYWTQYTPYFMDGDACVFSMNDIIVSNCDTEFVDYPEDIFGYADKEETQRLWACYVSSVGKYVKNPEHKELIKNVAQAFYDSEDLIKEVFGDHVRVICTKKGVKLEDYSNNHD